MNRPSVVTQNSRDTMCATDRRVAPRSSRWTSNRALAGDPAADLPLAPFDLLVVKQVSEWTQQEAVTVEGEVKFPGVYPIKRGETMRSLIARAGGLTAMAYPQGSVFTREYLKEREREQIRVLTDRMRQDLSSLALQSAQSGGQMASQAAETLNIGQSLLKDLQAAEPVGRLVIDLDSVLAAQPDRVADLVLRDGDHLRIPKMPQEVTVIGEVQNATSHLYLPNLTRDDYLSMSGGLTRRADDKRIYVVRASGSVDGGGGSRWFRSSGEMRPGDTIVVPHRCRADEAAAVLDRGDDDPLQHRHLGGGCEFLLSRL